MEHNFKNPSQCSHLLLKYEKYGKEYAGITLHYQTLSIMLTL